VQSNKFSFVEINGSNHIVVHIFVGKIVRLLGCVVWTCSHCLLVLWVMGHNEPSVVLFIFSVMYIVSLYADMRSG
jgi:hypothetical protein